MIVIGTITKEADSRQVAGKQEVYDVKQVVLKDNRP